MGMIFGKSEEKARMLNEKADALDNEISSLLEQIELDNALETMFSEKGWDKFVLKVLRPRAAALAEKRMLIPIDDREAHLLITGQYNEAVRLSRSKEELCSQTEENIMLLSKKRDENATVRAQLKKTKE